MEKNENFRNVFENISAIDYRYWNKELAMYLSEKAFIHYKLMVEIALVKALHKRGICDLSVFEEIESACGKVMVEEVYEEEKSLENCIRNKVSEKAKPFVHITATSFDISDTANAMRYRDVVQVVLLPALIDLEETLIELTKKQAKTLQIGRTHGQHAEPITFGFAMAEYVSRLGKCIINIERCSRELKGKFSGAVGAYNASFLFFDDPEKFEEEVLSELGLNPGDHSTQIVQPEPLTRLMFEIILAFGIMANLSDDMRHLQRTEIGEVGESFEAEQAGSSAMPQKRNPINFENVKSLWKRTMPSMITLFLDQISEHQRDLTNSASARTYGEIIAYFVSATNRLAKTMKKLEVDKVNMRENLELNKELTSAEPLYILLASCGHPNAYEKVKALTLKAQKNQNRLWNIVLEDEELFPYFGKMKDGQISNIRNLMLYYTGIAGEKAMKTAALWSEKINLLKNKQA